ncbi:MULTISPECIES: lipopolysaccharide biosynthesis protein [unclassified Rathayibacter]|uniref:lipopolysaccharide biosynthesis protein n=1 Tax=unclassified Rathayibacter TaxID=2609250 RepID=UPI00188A8937|nr:MULTISPECIES: lipopolysaccharide biosynthesis protein [unclassified Rathayibacter]MBF4463514.1 lipopolysaccharide biosynthesis protein [Rathayibacter sp. VKM Ac-2879]MBF4504764.1 lipopolysaccharide biosynthesis protein [Rathayibacter sp. VKM Ac-2878]
MSASLGGRALGGVSATLLWQGVRIGLLGLSIVILARLLSPSDYGLLAMVTAVIGVGELLRDLGLSVAAVQAKTLSPGEKTNLFWINTAAGFVLSVIVFLSSWGLAALYDEPRLVLITQVLALTFLVNGIATQFKAQINRDLRFMALGLSEAVPQAIGLVLAIIAAVAGAGYWALVVQAISVTVISLVLNVLFAAWFPGLPKRGESITRFLRFGGALAGTQGMSYVSKNIDNVMLGIFYDSAVLGFYSRAYQLIVLPLTQLTAPLSRVAIPILARLQDDLPQFLRYLRTGQFFTVALASLFYASMVGLAAPLTLILLGDKWLPVVPILQALAVSGIFRAMGQVPYWIFVALGLTGKQLRLYLVTQPIIIIAILVGVPWGGVGVAIGSSVGYLLFWFLQMWWAGRSSPISTGPLILSGLGLVGILAVPTMGIGLLVSAFVTEPFTAVAIGVGATALYAAAIVAAIPPYRGMVATIGSILARRRSRATA